MWDWTGFVWNWMQGLFSTIWEWFVWMWNNIIRFFAWVIQVFTVAFGWIAQGFRWLIRHLQALRHLNFRSIWNAIKRGYDRLQRALTWIKKTLYDPLERVRRQIMDIYRRFFLPLVKFLDRLRAVVRIVAIFDRRLAAKLDARLWALEAKILYPITASLRRLNSISSHLSALVTALGYLDRVTLLESIRRDASLVWEVLTNPRGRLYEHPPPPAPFSLREVSDNLSTYLKSGGGPLAAQVEALQARFDQSLLLLG